LKLFLANKTECRQGGGQRFCEGSKVKTGLTGHEPWCWKYDSISHRFTEEGFLVTSNQQYGPRKNTSGDSV
jgi:hypothetical protein